MKNNSGGSVPKRTGKRTSYERENVAEMNRKLSAALARLGDPVVEYRKRRDQLVKRKIKTGGQSSGQ
jgi:hypothetical protein